MSVGGSGYDYLLYKTEELSMEKELAREKRGTFEESMEKITDSSMKEYYSIRNTQSSQ